MAETTTPPVDNLRSPQFIIACSLLVIGAGVIFGVFLTGDQATKNLTVGAVLGYIGGVATFYFGSSSSSQRKDAIPGIQAAPQPPAPPAAPEPPAPAPAPLAPAPFSPPAPVAVSIGDIK